MIKKKKAKEKKNQHRIHLVNFSFHYMESSNAWENGDEEIKHRALWVPINSSAHL